MNTIKKKILVVDDDPVILKAFAIKLAASNYEVLTASKGEDAITAVRTEKPDAILLDLNFPDDFGSVAWDGFRILEWLKRLNDTVKTPIFVITGGDPDKCVARVRELGAVGFFRKPIIHEELVAALQRVFVPDPVATA